MAIRLVCLAALFSDAIGQTATNPLVIGQTFMAGSIDPTSGSTGWALTSHGISENLFTVNSAGVVVGQVAQSIKKLDKFQWEVTLKAGYKFSDGTPVTAAHVVDALMLLNQKNSNAKASLGTMTVTALDTSRVKIQSERATPVMNAVLAEWVFTIFLVKDGKYLFTGPYTVKTFVSGSNIDLIPNPHYPRAEMRKQLVIKKFSTGQSMVPDLKAGQIDMAFHLPVATLPELRAMSGITVKSFFVGYQYMMWHNTRRSPLSDQKVRKAVDIALDRSKLVETLEGGKGTRSFFPENTPYYQTETATQLQVDKSAAETLLDEAGWLKNANGKREKAGVALTLRAVAYPQRPGLVTMLPVIAQSLTALGITVNQKVTNGASWDELDAIMASQDFDLLLWAQHTLPSGDPSYFVSNFFRTNAGSNHAGLHSTDVDALIDTLSEAELGEKRMLATANAHNAILEQVPVSILMTPSWHIGLGSRLSNYQPWGSDYYVIHADFGFSNEVASEAYRGMLSGVAAATLLLLGFLC
jgi:peptide/nickel transport system substrate-binding protein